MKKIITILTAIATCASMSARMMVYSANDVEFYLKIVSASAGTISADGTIITFASPAEAKGAKLVVQEFIKADHSNPSIHQVGSTFSVNDKSISLDNGVSYSDPIGQEKEYTLNGITVTTDCFVSCFAYANKRKTFASGTGDATWGHSKDYTWAYDGVDQMTIIWASSFDDPNYDNSTETAHFQGYASDAFPFTQFEATIGDVTDGTYTIDIIDSWEHAELGTQNGTFINVDGKNKILVTNHPGIKIVVGDSGSSTDDPGNGGGTDTKDDVVSVTSGETTTNYESLDEAFKAAKDGDVITLKEDYAVPVDAGKDIYGLIDCNAGTSEAPVVLDLAGHTLSFPDGGHIIVNLGHALTIRDSGTGGKITSAEGYVVINTATGTLRLENGTLESTFTGDGNEQAKGAVYNRGVMFVDGGTVSGQKYGIYTEGALTLGEGKIAASQGFGVVVSSEGEITMLKFPEFDCMSDDIALADGKLIYYGGKIYGTPKNKIKIYLENKEQKYFTYGYGEDMRTEDGGITEPSDVFYVSGISDARIGFYETDRYLEAGIADETEVTFPAGNSTYFDERALALSEWNDDLKFYVVTSVDTENKSVTLTEIKSKRFGGHASLIVSNTSGAPITVKMVEAACGMMENSFIGSFNNDLRGDNDPDEVNIYPGFEGTDVAIDQIDKMDGFEYYGFNGEDFVPLSNLGPVEAHRCWLGIGEFPDFDEGDEGEGEEGGLPAGARKLSVVWPGSAAKSNTGASGETFNLTLATDAEAHGTVSFSVDGTTLTSDNKTASEGQTVTITVTPTVTQYSAYVVQSITAKPSMTTSQMKVRGNILDEVTLTPAGANTWTMTMPAADVEVGISYGTLSVAKEGYGTYYNSSEDVVLPSGVKAYVVTASSDGGTLTYEVIADGSLTDAATAVVPKATAVMLKMAESDATQSIDISLARPTAAAISQDNLLHGSDVAVETTGGGAGAKYYKLTYGLDNTSNGGADNSSVLGWYWGADGGAAFTSGAHKAWLALPPSISFARGFFGLPGDGETTGICPAEIKETAERAGLWYSLDGRKLNGKPSAKGVYIVGGKKVVIK